MQDSSVKPSIFKKPHLYFIIGLSALAWFFTGGFARQRVERFDAIGESYISADEQLHVYIRGDSSSFNIPFLLHNYQETAPFRLGVNYNNYGTNPPVTIRVLKARVVGNNGQPIDLISPGQSLTLQVSAHKHYNSSSDGISSHITHQMSHRFDQPVAIEFQNNGLVTCEIELELVYLEDVRRVTWARQLKGHRLDNTGTYWSYLSNC